MIISLIRIKQRILVAFFFLMVKINTCFSVSAITNDFWPGLFGDNISLYRKTKWFAHKYNLKFLYRPFVHSEELCMHRLEIPYDSDQEKRYSKKILLKNERDINENADALYVCQWSTQLNDESRLEMLTDLDFVNNIKSLIKPLKPVIIEFLRDRISVAVHIRRYTGSEESTYFFLEDEYEIDDSGVQSPKIADQYATDKCYRAFPMTMRFLPVKYYVDQLQKLYKLLDDKKLYVFIFSDVKNPEEIVRCFEKYCKEYDIIFDCRRTGNNHKDFVVEDFWAMTNFDCLLRPASNFSINVQYFGNHKLIITPGDSYWANGKLIVDNVKITIKEPQKMAASSFQFNHPNRDLERLLKQIF